MDEALKDIKALYGSYAAVIDEIGSSKIDNRFNKLKTSMNEFIKYLHAEDLIFVNTRILAIAILDYFTDIIRLKSFHHHIAEINEYKDKAYESAWLLRRKPIQVLNKNEQFDYINEQFVYQYLVFFLMNNKDVIDDANKLYESDKKEYNSAIKGFLNTLFYHLKFRDCNPQVLELILMSFRAGEVVKNIEIESGVSTKRKNNG